MADNNLSAAFTRRMGEAFGENGRQWVAALPHLIEAITAEWGLSVSAPYDLSYNYVAPATTAAGEPVVLKLGVPRDEFDAEAEVLNLYGGQGCVRLLLADTQRGAMLLERLVPGRTLDTLADDDAATEIAAGVTAQLWPAAPARHSLPTTQKWMQGFDHLRERYDGGTGPFPPVLVEAAERLQAELHASAAAPVVLHGDLHHYNILSAERAPWLAIDPQGVVGEPVYECGALLRNPVHAVYTWPDFAERTARRVAILSERLGFERQRIAGWGVAQAILSAWWTMEGHGTFSADEMRLAEVLLPLT